MRLKTNGAKADGEVVWSWHPDADVKFLRSKLLGDDGGKKARSPGRVRRKPLKPFARGMPGDAGVTVVTMLVCSFYFACEAAGASSARHSLRPLPEGANYRETRAFGAARPRTHVFRHLKNHMRVCFRAQ
jgi:hypothetical protein